MHLAPMEPSLQPGVSESPQRIRFDVGDRLPFGPQHKKILALTAGRVRLCLVNDAGKLVTLDILSPGEMLGPIANLHAPMSGAWTEEATNEATALEAGEALVYPVEVFQHLLDRNHELMVNFCAQMDSRRRRIEARLIRIVFKSSTGKVAGLLAELAERFGEFEAQVIRIPLRLTHKDLGSFIGVKRETVSLAMADLEYRELINTKGGFIQILDAEKLLRVA
jgi:CRP-like cAMP-binding protein